MEQLAENLMNEVYTLESKGVNQAVNFEKMVYTSDKFNNNNDLAKIETWINTREAVNLLSISKMAISKNCRAGKYTVRMANGNGGKQYEILLSSLPEFAQLKYARENRLAVPEEAQPEQNRDDLTPRQKEVALAKFDFITLWKEFRVKSNLTFDRADELFIQKYKSREYSRLYEILKGKGSIQSLYRDSKALDEAGGDYRVLAPGYRYGRTGPVITKREAVAIINYIKYPTKLKISEIIRRAKKDLYKDNFNIIRDDSTYRRWIEEWKNKNFDLWTLHRYGEKALNDFVAFFTKRDKSKVEFGDLFFIDGHITNFQVISPIPPYKPKRMTIITVNDYRTEVMTGWEIMLTENKYAIANAVRRSLLFSASICGYRDMAFKGGIVGIDNGRANKSHYLLGHDKKGRWFNQDMNEAGFKGLFEKLFNGLYVAQPYHGQTKTNEEFYRTFGELERSVITYSGTSIEDKPARMMRNEKLHKEVFERISSNVAMTIQQAHYLVACWMEEYVNRPHQSGFDKDKTPWQVMNESIERLKKRPEFESRLIPSQQLDYLMLEEKVTSLTRRGIHLNGADYYHENLYKYEKGKNKVDFLVKYDRDNKDSILVYDDKGGFVCQASKKDNLHPLVKFYGKPEELQEYNEQMKLKSQLRHATATAFKEHFEQEVKPMLPAAENNMIEAHIKKEEKRNKKNGKVIDKLKSSDCDYSITVEAEPVKEEEYDFKISEAV